jgi:hypothetical protein
VNFWYDNYFIANGSKNKLEVLKLPNAEKTKEKNGKRNKAVLSPRYEKLYV